MQPSFVSHTKKDDFVPSRGMTLIMSGVALAVRTPEKNQTPIAGEVYGPESWFGAYPVVMGLNTWRLQVLSEKCLCVHYHHDTFLEVFGYEKLLELLGQETANFESALLRTLSSPLNDRVYLAVNQISRALKAANPEMTRFRISRDTLALMVGSNQQCVSRCIAEMGRSGLLKIDSRQFML
jgi:CRP-like cAMP-binding protein